MRCNFRRIVAKLARLQFWIGNCDMQAMTMTERVAVDKGLNLEMLLVSLLTSGFVWIVQCSASGGRLNGALLLTCAIGPFQ